MFLCTLGRYKSPSTSRNLPPLSSDELQGEHPSLGPRYEWVDVGMLDYDPKTKSYLVKRVHAPKAPPLMNSEGSSEESDSDSDKAKEKPSDIQYWVPRVRLMFLAEDPVVFADRVSTAYESRRKTEALLR